MSEKERAQKILSWIERTQQENMQDDNTSLQQVTDRYHVLVEDIEKLCREHISKMSTPTGWCIVQDHGPELVYIPAGAQIMPTIMNNHPALHIFPAQSKDLWQIAEKVAETDPAFFTSRDWDEVPSDWYCHYCDAKQANSDYLEGEDFPHAATCIVTKARQLMEWRKQHAQI